MKRTNLIKSLLLTNLLAASVSSSAQLSSNPDKFLGNITTSYNVDYGKEKYYTLWNQITCENESKWASIEGNNNQFNFGGSDNAFNYAKSHNFPFKFHALVWGAQYPSWLEKQTPEQRYKEIVQWMDKVKEHYPNLQLIDVVNEAITGHQAGTPYFIEALGGTGTTGYDWLIKAFELAYERWPNAILIYNDFNTFQWNTDQYIDLVKTLRNAGAPIDAYGCQSHDLTDCSVSNFKSAMTKIQNALKMPMYSTEYDIDTNDDNLQLQRYKEQIPYMWEQDYVAGVTLWGYIHGKTWVDNSGIIKDGNDRPAMTWLREYMASDAAKNAKSPFPGMVKEASVYIKPSSLYIEKGNPATITVRAKMRTKTIEKVELYAKNVLVATMTEEPYIAEYTPTATGAVELKAVVTNTDGSTFERYSTITACNPRAPFKGTPTVLPGVLEAENFDVGAEGIAFHDANSTKEGTGSSYRSDVTGIDVERGGTGYAIGYGQVGEWMEYTVDVKKAGTYSFDISYSTPINDAAINLALHTADGLVPLTEDKVILPTTSDWSAYKTVHKRLLLPLEEGQQILRLSLVGGSDTYVINIDKLTFANVEINENIKIALSADTEKPMATEKTTITADVNADKNIKNVKFYINGSLTSTDTSAPYELNYTPKAKGEYAIMAIATDEDGNQSPVANYTLNVSPLRKPYKGVIQIPGTVEAENFDMGGEKLSFHDTDAKDEGNTKYRTDNEGVDILSGNGGYVIGKTATGEWLEYTLNVTEKGKYSFEATVSSATTGGVFYLNRNNNGSMSSLSGIITVPNTGSLNTYKTVKGNVSKELEEGELVIRLYVNKGNFNIDKLKFINQTTGVEEIAESNAGKYNVYTTEGVLVGQFVANGIEDVKAQIYSRTGTSGAFIVKNTTANKTWKLVVSK